VAIVDPPVPRRDYDRRYQLRQGTFMQAYRKLTAAPTPPAPAQPSWLRYNLVILPAIKGDSMSATPQERALKNYRNRLVQRGMARFEVLGLDTDRALIRSLAKRLAANDPDAAGIRATVRRAISAE